MNKRALEAKLKMNGETGTSIAKKLGIARTTFSEKLNETRGREFTQTEIIKMKNILNLTAEEINNIFFMEKVS